VWKEAANILLKKNISLSKKTLNYVKRIYQSMYKKVISEAQKRENSRSISRSVNHTKALWQIINKDSGSYQRTNQNISLKICPHDS
jgi:hypothetical protein